jgi:peptide/nickel transport system permease protein
MTISSNHVLSTKQEIRAPSSLRRLLRAIYRDRLAMMGILIVLVTLIVAFSASWLAPYDPIEVNFSEKLLPPSPAHLLGTDENGRDILSRCMFGIRISLEVAVVVLSVAVTLGIVLGGLAGFVGGRVDEVLMRITDMFLAFPALVLALAISAALRPSLNNAMLAVAIVWWPWYARLVRAQTLSIKQLPYVEAARALGSGEISIFVRHILPNCIAPVLVMASLDVGFTILMTASLSFVGLGAQSPTPELGAMIGRGRIYMLDQWWVPTFPGLVIFIMILGVNLMGDSVRDLLDPRFYRPPR